MCEIKLIKPTIEYSEDIIKYKQEFIESDNSLAGCGSLRHCNTAEEWFASIERLESTETCPEGLVPSNTYIAVRLSDNKIVGITDLRHNLGTPGLKEWGGHIGYSVRPDERRKGYATEMLRQNLLNAKKLGLDRVTISCNEDNIASERTIIANGGVFEKTVLVDGERPIKRFWISIK